MQKLTVDPKSDLGAALLRGIPSEGGPVLSIKSHDGDSIYRGIVHHYSVKTANGKRFMEIGIQGWDEYWGKFAASRHGV